MIYKDDEYNATVQWLNDRTIEYDAGNPTVSDSAWDKKYFAVQEYEYENPDKINSNSPTQKIHFETVSKLEKRKHNHPMLSLAKTKSIDELKDFIGDKPYIIMAKMDGLTCSLYYENGKLVSAETRGNGEVGEDITHNAMVIPSIPKRISYNGSLTVDGEIICTYANFHNWCKEYKNPRNFAAGSIRLLDSKECSERDLTFIAWDMFSEEDTTSLDHKLFILETLNFITVPHNVNTTLDDNLQDVMDTVKNKAEFLSYPIDGLVIKYNLNKDYDAAGRTDHHFKGGIAYKFYDEEYETRLKYIHYDVSRTGILTPVAVFDPINIDGAIVERASLHNMSVMHDILGDTPYCGELVWVKKSNQIIPQITRAKKMDYGDIIAHGGVTCDLNGIDGHYICPSCKCEAEIEKSDTGVEILKCTNPQCNGKLINRLDHFYGKKGLDIKGLSKKTLEKLIDWGWVKGIEDMFNLRKHQVEWINQPGFGKASVLKIIDAIDESRFCTLAAFISALGIPLVGTKVSKIIAQKVKTWESFRELIDSNYDFSSWDGFGYEMYKALLDFDYDEADKIYSFLNIQEVKEEAAAAATLKDMNFAITGKLHLHKNRQELIDRITSAGGNVQSSVNSKTNFLINNDKTSSSAKNLKAKELGVTIITEDDLMEVIKGYE